MPAACYSRGRNDGPCALVSYMRTRERTALLARANTQFGLLRYEHLIAAGLTPTAVARWLAAGQLTRLHHKVYALGHCVLRPEGRWLAATWACGNGAVLSHLSAAAFHGLRVEPPGEPVHVSTTGEAKSRPGIVVQRVRTLDRVDVFDACPLRVTHVPRTLIDLADELGWLDYRAAADKISQLRLDTVAAAQRRAPGRRGAGLVRRFLEADDAHTKSEFERRYTRFVARHSLPRPDGRNVRVAGYKADCVYFEARLVVELDGRAHHQRRDQMRADRKRDRRYQSAGFDVARLVWDDLHPAAAGETAGDLRRMLAAT